MGRRKEKRCCICGRPIVGYGNNPWPVKMEGYCCDICNYKVVVPERIKALAEERHADR